MTTLHCPQCGAEYRPEVLTCSDCGVALTSRPPVEPDHDAESMVAVFRSADASLIPVLKSVLSAAEIPYTVQGEESSALFPFGPAAIVPDSRRLGAVLRVPESRVEEAKALLESTAPEEHPEG